LVERLSIKEIVRRTGHGRNTIRRALRSGELPWYRRPPRPSKLDPFREEIHRLLREEPRLPGRRVRELLEEQGYAGGKTILDDYLREVRPLFLPRPRTFQRTSYRPGALCQFDLWEPSREIPVGAGQTRRGCVVVGCLPYSRAGAATLVFSKEALDVLYGIGRVLVKLGGLPEALVWDREGALHAGGGHPSEVYAAFCGVLGVGWRFVTRVPPDPYVRVDTCDYSLDPRLVGRRVEVRVSQREILAACLDTGELAAQHTRSFARHRTITALEHARALRELRGAPPEPEVETRPLARYDQLIPA